MTKKSSDPEKVRHIQELRRSNAATRVPSGKEYNRAKTKRETQEEGTRDGN